MIDDPLEQLRIELSIEPSPEFAAKVRARIAREPKRRWTAMAMWSLAAAAVVVLAVVALRPGRGQATHVAVAEAPSAVVAPAPQTPAARSAVLAPRATQSVVAAAVRTAAPEPGQAPSTRLEVLVPPDQDIALRRLLAGIRSGGLTVPPRSEVFVVDSGDVPSLAAIEIPPIKVEPLVTTSPGGTGGSH